ncbi:MAG TPA: biotin/lipoyl-containing protein, partial [Thermoanaerobaculia bacterium]|nr:biotin/lipoyl-containing protein [Thermoanaerobaculia bacterium]
MATEVVMPQMGESIAEGTITKWRVKVGDRVERDQPLFEISTDKVDAEIPSPAGGTLLEIRNQEGETVPVNQVVAVIGEAGEQPAAGAEAPAAPAQAAEPAVADVVQGTGAPPESTEEIKRAEEARDTGAAPQPTSPEPQPQPQAQGGGPAEGARPAGYNLEEQEKPQAAEGAGAESAEDRLRKFSSPLVRSIAAKEGVNLEEVPGTGAQGRVT